MPSSRKKNVRTALLGILLITVLVPFWSCKRDHVTPLPKAYIRIDTPPHAYRLCDTVGLPFSFEISREATLLMKQAKRSNEVWADIEYPAWKGIVYLSYRRLMSPADLRGQTDTSQRMLERHYQVTSGIEEQQYADSVANVYATTFHLKGSRVASTYEFWATDSTKHFLHGSLHIDRTPNNDSLAPILQFIHDDIDHMIETLRWK